MPASPAETADCCALHDPIECDNRTFGLCCERCSLRRAPVAASGMSTELLAARHAITDLLAERDALRAAAHVHCGCNLAHKPAQDLANLLRTATEFVEMVDSSSAYTDADVALFDALRAAVHALNEPLAPSRLADAHAAPATGGAP